MVNSLNFYSFFELFHQISDISSFREHLLLEYFSVNQQLKSFKRHQFFVSGIELSAFVPDGRNEATGNSETRFHHSSFVSVWSYSRFLDGGLSVRFHDVESGWYV